MPELDLSVQMSSSPSMNVMANTLCSTVVMMLSGTCQQHFCTLQGQGGEKDHKLLGQRSKY